MHVARILAALTFILSMGTAAAGPDDPLVSLDLSLVLEAGTSLRRGGNYLLERQMDNGSWANHTVITSLAVLALSNSPYATDPGCAAAISAGLDYLASQAQEGGGIWNQRSAQYPLYSTALSLLGLVRANRSEDDQILRQAREFLLHAQVVDVPVDSPDYGGFSDPSGGGANLTMSQWVLEALYLTDYLDSGRNGQAAAAYRAAALFIGRCQLSDQEAEERGLAGSFSDFPGRLGQSDESRLPGTPRSRAFLTAAGLKSLLYSRVPRDDERAVAAVRWICRNYSVEDNPQLGEAGYYTYLFTLTEALHSLSRDLLPAPADDWRRDVVLAMLRRQKGDGSWHQGNPDWWENHPELVTAYGLLTLELACAPQLQPAGGLH